MREEERSQSAPPLSAFEHSEDTAKDLRHGFSGSQRGALMAEVAGDAAKAALALLGNAVVHVSKERRKRVIFGLNKKLHPLAEEEDIFTDALLGKVFESKTKDHLESL